MRMRKAGSFFHLALGTPSQRDAVIKWKKDGHALWKKGKKPPAPPNLENIATDLHSLGLERMDIITIPPASFHTYDTWCPALILAKNLSVKKIDILWPEKYEKAGMIWHENISKVYKKPRIPVKGKFILVLDDIVTTGNTLHACAKAIAKAGGFPFCVGVV